MKKIPALAILFIYTCAYTQDNSNYLYKPFSIFTSSGQTVIAGSVNTFVYTNYFGRNVKNEHYTDSHDKPEYLVYQLFTEMKIGNVDGIDKLYDETFDRKNFDHNKMAEMLNKYSDIKFASKFKWGDLLIVRYDFISNIKSFPFFAAVRNINGKYFLTTSINVSAPFNVVGSFSPNNLFEKKENTVNTKGMTPFYFVSKGGKVLFTNDAPPDDYAGVYFDFEFYTPPGKSPEADFLAQLQKAAHLPDSFGLEKTIAQDQRTLLGHTYYHDYFYAEITKIFKNYEFIVLLGSLKINDGKILYFKYGSAGETPSHVGSIVVKRVNNKYYLALRITDDNINNILWNVYIREAIYDFFSKR